MIDGMLENPIYAMKGKISAIVIKYLDLQSQ